MPDDLIGFHSSPEMSPEILARFKKPTANNSRKPRKKFKFLVGPTKFGTIYRIAHKRTFHPRLGRYPTGQVLLCVDKGNSLSFRSISYCGFKKPTFGFKFSYSICYKNGTFNVYWCKGGDVNKQIKVSPFNIDNIITLCGLKIRAVYKRRAKRLVRQFLRRHSYRWDNKYNLNKNIFFACYPGIKFWIDNFQISDCNLCFIGYLFKTLDINKTFRLAFGSNGKELKKLIFNEIAKTKNCQIFKLGVLTKCLIPLDYIMVLVKNLNIKQRYFLANLNKQRLKILRKIFKKYSQIRIKKLLESTDEMYLVYDMCRMFEMYGNDLILPEKPASFKDIHDSFSLQSTRLETKEVCFDIKEKVKKIDGIKFADGLEIVVPNSSNDLIQWGETMHHCIASYARSMKNNHCLLLGIKKDGDLKYNLEIQNKKIIQMRGKYNVSLDAQDVEPIEKVLFENEIINVVSQDYVWAADAQKHVVF